MAGPITWRNVEAPDFRGALLGLGQAQQSFQGALTPLMDALRQRETIDAANWQNSRANNTEDLLSQVTQRFQTPEALAAAQRDGTLQALLSSANGPVDRTQLRTFVDNRQPLLVQRARELGLYTDEQEKRGVQEAFSRAGSDAALGKTEAVRDALAKNPTLAKWFAPQLTQTAVTGERDMQRFGWEGDKAFREQDLHPLNKQAIQSQMANDATRARAAMISAMASREAAAASAARERAAKDPIPNILKALEVRKGGIEESLKGNAFGGLNSLADPGKNIALYQDAIKKNYRTKWGDVWTPNIENLQEAIAAKPGVEIDVGGKKQVVPWPAEYVAQAAALTTDRFNPEKQFMRELEKLTRRGNVAEHFGKAQDAKRALDDISRVGPELYGFSTSEFRAPPITGGGNAGFAAEPAAAQDRGAAASAAFGRNMQKWSRSSRTPPTPAQVEAMMPPSAAQAQAEVKQDPLFRRAAQSILGSNVDLDSLDLHTLPQGNKEAIMDLFMEYQKGKK